MAWTAYFSTATLPPPFRVQSRRYRNDFAKRRQHLFYRISITFFQFACISSITSLAYINEVSAAIFWLSNTHVDFLVVTISVNLTKVEN
jgi:hypothetical protein